MEINVSKKAAVATGAAAGSIVGGVAVAANITQIAEYLSSLSISEIALSSVAIGASPFVWAPLLSVASVGLGAAVASRRERNKAQAAAFALAEEHNTAFEVFKAQQAQSRSLRKKFRHNYYDVMRTYLALQIAQAANNSMDAGGLCKNFAMTMRAQMDTLDCYFSEDEGEHCRVTLYTLDEDNTLHPRTHFSQGAERDRRALSIDQPRLSTAMKKILEMSPTERPIVKMENLSNTASDWQDARTDEHHELYNSSLTIAVQCQPDHGMMLGRFRQISPQSRVLAGFLVVESKGDRFNSPNIEDDVASFADHLFSVLSQVSEASHYLGGDYGWLYRALVSEQKLDLAAE